MTHSKKNILIVANFPPEGGWGGGVIIRSLIHNHPKEYSFYWTTFSPADNALLNNMDEIKALNFRPTYIKGQSKIPFLLKLDVRLFAHTFNTFVKAHKIDAVWFVLGTSAQQLYRLAVLSEHLNVPYHVSVHDDPILEIPDAKKEKAKQHLRSILQRASSVDVISKRMQTLYATLYGVQTHIVTRGIPASFPTNSNRLPHQLDIIMAGYGNASSPWPQPLLETNDKLNENRLTNLHLFDPKLSRYENNHVKVYGLLKEEAFNKILTGIHIGYACDDLHPDKLAFAQLSLPTKIITYIGAGIPFVYHGPDDSTVGDLLKQYKAGIIVSSNNVKELTDAFEDILSNYEVYQKACSQARAEKFDDSVIQEHFYTHFIPVK